MEFVLVAAAGIALQAGVVVFAGVGAYLPPWNERFERGGKPVQKDSFPLMAGETVALVIGMFLCCYIVDRSTTGGAWAIAGPDRHRVRVAWLQKGGEVDDQHFKSYILHRPATGPLIRTSHKSSYGEQGSLTMLAVAVSLAGFVCQFVGLRALTWRVAIAQLAATGAMRV